MARRSNELKSNAQIEPVDASAATEKQPAPIDFNVWFSLLLAANSNFKEWQRSQLRAFMHSKGLSDRETKARYDEELKKF